jgi:hypothetical protein
MIFRFVITILAMFLALRLLRSFIRLFQGKSSPSQSRSQSGQVNKPKVEYKDVKDAKFTELQDEQTKDQSS